MNTLETRLAEATAKAETLERSRTQMEEAMTNVGRIAGPEGLKACVAGILLRAQMKLWGAK